MRLPRWLGWTALFLSGGFWLLAVPIPLGALFAQLPSVSALFDPTVVHIARNTLFQALASTLFSALIGLPFGLWIGRFSSPFLRGILAVSYAVPTVVAASSWIAWLGRSGLLVRAGLPESMAWAYSWKAVILAHVFFNAPWIALQIADSRRTLPNSWLEAGETLGASRWMRFSRIIWPHVRGAFSGASVQVFSLCVMSFALVLILGGGPPVETLETALYGRIRYGALDLQGAAACGVWQLLMTLVPWVWVVATGQTSHLRRSGAPKKPGSRASRWLALGLAMVFLLPYLATIFVGKPWLLLERGVSDSELRSELSGPFLVSLKLALGSAVAVVSIALAGVIAAKTLRFGLMSPFLTLFGVPSGVSVLVLGLGAWMAYSKWVDPFAGSLTAMVLLQTTVFYPVALRMFWPLAQKVPLELLEAAETLGATSLQAFWTVEWPRWRGPLLAAFGMALGASLAEVAAVSLFYSEELFPLPLVLARWMAQYRFDDAQGLAAILFVLSSSVTAGVAVWGYSDES